MVILQCHCLQGFFINLNIMKNIFIALFLFFPSCVFAQLKPVAVYDGGDLYFIPAKLTSNGIPFMYSCKEDHESGKNCFTIFDDEVKIVKQAEVDAQILNYTTRTITSQRRYFVKSGVATRTESDKNEYFLDEWTVISDVTEEKTQWNDWVVAPEVYEDNNNYHSRYMYLSQILFDEDEEFEFLRPHYEVMPLSYCATNDKSDNEISMQRPSFGGEECDEYIRDYDYNLGGYVFTLIRYEVYGGIKHTGTDVISLNGSIKKTLDGITSLGSIVSINGNYYVSAYDSNSSKYGLYKIAAVSTSLSRVADISSETCSDVTYNLDGIRVKPDTKGVVIRNGRKIFNR